MTRTTYRVSGTAHGEWFAERWFGDLFAAQAYASSIIDGDLDATIEITKEGVSMIGYLPFPGIWQAYCGACGYEECYRSEADARMASALHTAGCSHTMEEEGGTA